MITLIIGTGFIKLPLMVRTKPPENKKLNGMAVFNLDDVIAMEAVPMKDPVDETECVGVQICGIKVRQELAVTAEDYAQLELEFLNRQRAKAQQPQKEACKCQS